MAKDDRTTVKSVKVDTKLSITHREETNSAMGSWSGYIYQGLCGILVVLRMLRANVAVYKDYSLQLDGYEDFSILDEQGKIVSMHQCKSDKNRTNYDEEFKKMKAKVDGLAAQGILQNPANSPCYFHCNRQVTIAAEYKVSAYQFEAGKTYCEPGNIQGLLDAEVAMLKKEEADTPAVRAALETIVNGEVLNTQQAYFNASKTKLYEIARLRNIPFAQFAETLGKTLMSYAPGDFLLQMKQAYILGMEERAAEEEDEEIRERVGLFTQRLRELSDDEMRKFLQRVNPKDKLEDTHQCWHDITTGERLNYLYNLVTEFPLDTKALHWETAKSRQTPSTLGNDMKVTKASKLIYENQANLDFPWIYDWIVGHVDEHVENIEDAAHIINKTENESDGNNIFHTKKVGILTKKEKQDGTFD